MTLARCLTGIGIDRVMPVAIQHFADAIAQPPVAGGLSFFREPSPGADFSASYRFNFPTKLHKDVS